MQRNEKLLHREYGREKRLVYHHSPRRAVIVSLIFLIVCLSVGIFMLKYTKVVALILGFLSLSAFRNLLKQCSVKVWIDWPNIVYRYRSLFRRIDEVFQPWELSGFNSEVTSMWRGSISESMYLDVGEESYMIAPYYSRKDEKVNELMHEVYTLPDSRKQAEYELELERRVAMEKAGIVEENDTSRELFWCMLEMNIECPRCDAPVTVNGPFLSLDCSECGAQIDMNAGIWADLLEDIRDEIVEDLEDGEGTKSSVWGVYNTTLYYGRLAPYCPECKTDLIMPEDTNGLTGVECSNCGKKVNAMQAPDWFDEVFSEAKMIVAADKKQMQNSDKEDASQEPVTFTCDKCGASLKTNGESRTMKCSHCGNSLYLPDDLWLFFHPASVKKRWFVGFEAEVSAL